MKRYQSLIRILDTICSEAPEAFKSYHPDITNVELVNQARAKAFIHLLLKVYFGIFSFAEREKYLTDDVNDGGIDGYFIDTDAYTIYFIQSKFRTTKENFESKSIKAEEILSMEINRILDGETSYENGSKYSSKILAMQSKIRQIEDIGRYRYKVIILANVHHLQASHLRTLTGGFSTEVIDYEQCYSKLVFPVITGTFYNESTLHVSLNLSNKVAGSKISYTVNTVLSKCEITVVFVPTLEIAKILHKYRNSILKYNPRSYLDIEHNNVNVEIRKTIIEKTTNEFALFNNGITMLSDDTYLNERIGQKDRAQLTIINPQIINGGQTAFTLSRIYAEYIDKDFETLFKSKEVLLKIITFQSDATQTSQQRHQLIDDISVATNQQTAVTNADRRSNQPELIELQEHLFTKYGIFLERKRGEYGDGIREGYIDNYEVINRTFFIRLCYSCRGEFEKAHRKKMFIKTDIRKEVMSDISFFDKIVFGLHCYFALCKKWDRPPYKSFTKEVPAIIYVAVKHFYPDNIGMLDSSLSTIEKILFYWSDFESAVASKPENGIFFFKARIAGSKEVTKIFNFRAFYHTSKSKEELDAFFNTIK